MNIVNTWIDVVRNEHGKTLAEGIKQLNKITGLNISHSQVYKWRSSKYSPSAVAVNYMTQYVFKYALNDAGIKTSKITLDQYEHIFNLLMVPMKK